MVSRFAGPDALFRSDVDNNALVFRALMRCWPKSEAARAVLFTTLTSLYHFIVVNNVLSKRFLDGYL